MKNQKGFTLIELLIVIGILAILTSVIIIAINPARNFAMERCARLGHPNDESCIDRETKNPTDMDKIKNVNRW